MLNTLFKFRRNTTYAHAVQVGLIDADIPVPFLVEPDAGGAVAFHTDPRCYTPASDTVMGALPSGDLLKDRDRWCVLCAPAVHAWNEAVDAEDLAWLNWSAAVYTLGERLEWQNMPGANPADVIALYGEAQLLDAAVSESDTSPRPELDEAVEDARDDLATWLPLLKAAAEQEIGLTGSLAAAADPFADSAETEEAGWWLLLPRALDGYRVTAHAVLESHEPEVLASFTALGRGQVHGLVTKRRVTPDVRLVKDALLVRSAPADRVRVQLARQSRVEVVVPLTRHGHAAAAEVRQAFALAPSATSLATVPDQVDDLVLALCAGAIPMSA